jgi:amino-acid N-acetyltransferase
MLRPGVLLMTSGAQIRAARPSDEPAIVALLEAAGLPLAGVHDVMPGFLVAEANGRIVGSAAVEACGESGTYALLRSVAVDSSMQGSGIGRALVDQAIERARSQDVIDLYLRTMYTEAWFKTFGFLTTTVDAAPDEIRANVQFQGACPSSAVVMVLPLVGA